MKALTKHIAHKVATGKESLITREAVRESFQNAMGERVARIIKEAANLQRKEGLPHYLDCYAGHTAAAEAQRAQDEGVLDAVKHVGKEVASGIAKDGFGISTKAIGRVVRALRKRKPKVTVSKVPPRRQPKVKPTAWVHTEPVKIDRKEFAAKLKQSSGDLRKVKL
jgi:hypothetical protein